MLEVGYEGGGGLVGVFALFGEVVGEVVVVVPAHVVELREAYAAFGHASCEEAVAGVGAGGVYVGSVQVEDVLRLGEGSVVELDKLAGDPVDVYVNDRLVVRGEVLVLNDNFCVRVNEIISDIWKEFQTA